MSHYSLNPGDEKGIVKPKLCFLCEDATADVRFEPCGHIIMCRKCAERVKKCPTCRVSHHVLLYIVKLSIISAGLYYILLTVTFVHNNAGFCSSEDSCVR